MKGQGAVLSPGNGVFRSMRALAAATGSLETRYRVQKCAGEWTVDGVQRGEGVGHLGCVLCLEGSLVTSVGKTGRIF